MKGGRPRVSLLLAVVEAVGRTGQWARWVPATLKGKGAKKTAASGAILARRRGLG